MASGASGGWTTAAAPRKQRKPAARKPASGERYSGERDARRREGGEGRSGGGDGRERGDRGSGVGRGERGQGHNASKPTPPLVPTPTEPIGGFIFFCNNETFDENIARGVFGLVARWQLVVKEIKPGLPLFLYNYSNKEMHGGFVASSVGALNIDPEAWLLACFGNKPKARRVKKVRAPPGISAAACHLSARVAPRVGRRATRRARRGKLPATNPPPLLPPALDRLFSHPLHPPPPSITLRFSA